MDYALGIDLGGTKAEIIALDRDGRECLRHRVPHPKGSYELSLETLAALVAYAEAKLGPDTSLGICHPGAMSPKTGLLEGANATWLNGKPFAKDLQSRLNRPIAFANDANCLALSEAQDGAAAGFPIVFAMIVGTGCGGGLAIDRRVVAGSNAMAGEICHVPLPWAREDERPGPDCYCGKSGCLDAWLSGPALQADHLALGGKALSAQAIAQAAMAGDPIAQLAIERLQDRLGRALAMLIQILDPDIFVLGGGLSNIDSLYRDVPRIVRKFTAFDAAATELRKSLHGDSSGVRGAAWMGRDLAHR